MGLSRTVSEINGEFGRKSHIFPSLVYLTLALRGGGSSGMDLLKKNVHALRIPTRDNETEKHTIAK